MWIERSSITSERWLLNAWWCSGEVCWLINSSHWFKSLLIQCLVTMRNVPTIFLNWNILFLRSKVKYYLVSLKNVIVVHRVAYWVYHTVGPGSKVQTLKESPVRVFSGDTGLSHYWHGHQLVSKLSTQFKEQSDLICHFHWIIILIPRHVSYKLIVIVQKKFKSSSWWWVID